MPSAKPPSSSPPSKLYCHLCQATETPLWRAGPDGPKTLCNACGVRYRKHGVLTPRTNKSNRRRPPKSTTRKNAPTKKKTSRTGAVQKRAGRPSSSTASPSSSSASTSSALSDAAKTLTTIYGIPKAALAFSAKNYEYESIFSGLMVVQRDTRKVYRKMHYIEAVDEPEPISRTRGSGRRRSKTAKGKKYEEEKSGHEERKKRVKKSQSVEKDMRRISAGDEKIITNGTQSQGLSLLLAAATQADAFP